MKLKRQLDKSLNDLSKKIGEMELGKRITHQEAKLSPEEDYQDRKKNWYFHESSWYMRELNSYDGQGCNQFTGCIPECRYYPEHGRIEEEVIK